MPTPANETLIITHFGVNVGMMKYQLRVMKFMKKEDTNICVWVCDIPPHTHLYMVNVRN